jgi:hypothetical protein
VIRTRFSAIAALVLLGSLTGCVPFDPRAEPNNATATSGDAPVETELTWQEAKAQTQAMELEIAKRIPEEKVLNIKQKDTGILFRCGETQHNWNGSAKVTLIEGIEEASIVKALEKNYQEGAFAIETDLDVVEDYRVQLRSPDTAESYLIVKDDPGTISINSGSACFTLPDGVYPGGDF